MALANLFNKISKTSSQKGVKQRLRRCPNPQKFRLSNRHTHTHTHAHNCIKEQLQIKKKNGHTSGIK